MSRRLLLALGALAAAGVVYGALGGLHRSVDAIALLRPVLALGALAAALTARAWVLRGALGAAAAFGLVTSALPALPQAAGGDLRVYSKNMRLVNWQTEPIAQDILSTRPDVVLLQEISSANDAILDRLSQAFPHQHLCRYPDMRHIAILSRVAFEGPGRCTDIRALAAVRITLDGAPVSVVSAHVPWVWPKGSDAAERALLSTLRQIERPIVMAGDFNAMPWMPRFRAAARAAGVRLAGPMRHSFTAYRVPLFIDHALAPGGGHVTRRPRFGSDHYGLLADLAL